MARSFEEAKRVFKEYEITHISINNMAKGFDLLMWMDKSNLWPAGGTQVNAPHHKVEKLMRGLVRNAYRNRKQRERERKQKQKQTAAPAKTIPPAKIPETLAETRGKLMRSRLAALQSRWPNIHGSTVEFFTFHFPTLTKREVEEAMEAAKIPDTF